MARLSRPTELEDNTAQHDVSSLDFEGDTNVTVKKLVYG